MRSCLQCNRFVIVVGTFQAHFSFEIVQYLISFDKKCDRQNTMVFGALFSRSSFVSEFSRAACHLCRTQFQPSNILTEI